jgi:hypothetical protein
MGRSRHNHPARAGGARAAYRRSARWSAAAGVGGVVLLGAATPWGGAAALAVGRFLEFYTGVFALVMMTATVLCGLLATDRIVLLARHRVFAQVVHRAAALSASAFLVIHILAKVVEGHARAFDVLVPFLAGHRPFAVGLGTVAGYGLGLAVATGLLRRRFVIGDRPRLWRALHYTAYASWLCSIGHGLSAGRHPKTWVSASYWICVAVVALAIAVRVIVDRHHRATAGSFRVGNRSVAGIPRPGVRVGPPTVYPQWSNSPAGVAAVGFERVPERVG